jgi:hypothetical protein
MTFPGPFLMLVSFNLIHPYKNARISAKHLF